MADEFMKAIQKARLELTQVEAEQKRLAQRKAQLLQTIAALAPLLTEQPTREALSLADAIRTVISAYEMNNPGTIYKGKLVGILLDEMGFDFTGYNENHLAAIWNALKRMYKAGELKLADDSDSNGGYKIAGGGGLDVPNPLGQTLADMLKEPKRK